MGVIITPHCSKIHSTFGVKITPKRELKYWSKKYSQIGVNWDLFFTPLLESNLLLENNSVLKKVSLLKYVSCMHGYAITCY